MMEQNNQNNNFDHNQKNDNQSKQILLSVLAVAILVVAVVGVSFAAFTYVGLGTKENVISTGTISMSYTEPDNAISISNAMPVNDEIGKTIAPSTTEGDIKVGEESSPTTVGTLDSGASTVFDFTVHAEIAGTATINYEVAAVSQENKGMTMDEGNTQVQPGTGTSIENKLDGQFVKFYLEKDEKGGTNYSAVSAPTTYADGNLVKEQATNAGSPVGSLVLASGTFTEEGTHAYRLRMWLSEDYVVTGEAETFVARINVYGKAA